MKKQIFIFFLCILSFKALSQENMVTISRGWISTAGGGIGFKF
jgi:hypothetical protein